MIQKKSFGGYDLIEEGYEFKATIAWDLPCCPIHFNDLFMLHVSTLTTTKDFLVLCCLLPCYLWGIALGSFVGAQLQP